MISINEESCIPISFSSCGNVNKIAFDGSNYYFTLNNINQILKSDVNSCVICT